ncbi:MAG: terminase gpA endonuclease subunit, partial [Thermoguttaceae bacterium]
LYLFDQKAFWSEYMNEPLEQEMEAENLTQDDLLRKIRVDLPKGIAPPETTAITAGIDVQKDCLYWLVTAWGEDFSGHVLEYGRYPKGNAKMETRWPGCSLEEQVCNSLVELSQTLQAKTYRRDTGEELGIGKVIVDSNWGLLTDAVKKVCRQVQPRCWLEPTQGWGKGPDQRFLAKAKQIGEIRGPEWKKEPVGPKGICRSYTYNTNYWKSFVRARIQAGINARSSLTFYKGDILIHQKFFQHLLGECSSKLTGQYGTIDKWILKPGAPNHWFDCLIMAAVAASASGVKMPEVAINTGNKKGSPVITEAAATVVTNRKVNVLI